MKTLLTILMLFVLVACNENMGDVKSGDAAPNVPKGIIVRNTDDFRLFAQIFELEDGTIFSIRQCIGFNSLCEARISFYSDDGDDTNDYSCKADASVDEKGGMRLWNATGDSVNCKALKGTYHYEVTECQGFAQTYYPCGYGAYPYSLTLEKID